MTTIKKYGIIKSRNRKNATNEEGGEIIMVNVNKLKGMMAEKEISIEKLANEIGIDTSSLYRKLSANGETILIREADEIARALNLNCDDATKIFFAQYVA